MGKIETMNPILNPTIQLFIVHMYTMFEGSIFNSTEKTVTKKKKKKKSHGITDRPNPVKPTFFKAGIWGIEFWHFCTSGRYF